MKLASKILLLSSLALAFAACANDDETIPVTKTGDIAQPKLVGRVASIPSDKRFVLIESYGKWEVAAGSLLTSRGADERTANLLVTGEALGQYAAADFQGGDVQVGDAVYSRETKKTVAAPTETVPLDEHSARPFN